MAFQLSQLTRHMSLLSNVLSQYCRKQAESRAEHMSQLKRRRDDGFDDADYGAKTDAATVASGKLLEDDGALEEVLLSHPINCITC